MLATHQQWLSPLVETTEPDQTARPAIGAMKHRQIAPGGVVARVANRLAAETAAAVLGQFARQIGDLLVGRIVADLQVERQHGKKIVRGGIVLQRCREVLIRERKSETHDCSFPIRRRIGLRTSNGMKGEVGSNSRKQSTT
jgi:hypothetical protein